MCLDQFWIIQSHVYIPNNKTMMAFIYKTDQ